MVWRNIASFTALLLSAVLIGVLYVVNMATAQTPVPLDLPARTIPVPDTVSSQMQKLIAAPLNPMWNVIPKTADEWKAQVNASAAGTLQTLPALRQELHVKVEPLTIDGVKAYMVTPENIPPENRNRLLVHVHGGCYVFFPGEAGTRAVIP
jgi:acetyl esterase/lipase